MSDVPANEEAADGVVGELSGLFQSLEASGYEPPAERQRRPPRPLVRPVSQSPRRPAVPAALAVADGILLAARGAAPVPRQLAPHVAAAPASTAAVPPPPALVTTGAANLAPPPPPGAAGAPPALDTTTTGAAVPDRTVTWSSYAERGRPAVINAADRTGYTLYDGEALVIGRSPGPGGVVVNSDDVSRAHVRIEVRLGRLLATELGSTNGTTLSRDGAVQDLERNSPTPLRTGDLLSVGGTTVLCTVQDEGEYV